ncbi:hypothetical protein [Streptomyces sp. NPDC058548]|uniref:hypothetical protein n=1 Tax=unclassified Streptomyces TaxID=2593676 RepID=UPI003665A463
MAEKLKALGDLKRYFAQYEEFDAGLKSLQRRIEIVNRLNKNSAGDDQIGKQYHSQVDAPTKNLTDTIAHISKVLGRVSTAGSVTTTSLDNADEQSTNEAKNW